MIAFEQEGIGAGEVVEMLGLLLISLLKIINNFYL
jgi:hypothetical protein